MDMDVNLENSALMKEKNTDPCLAIPSIQTSRIPRPRRENKLSEKDRWMPMSARVRPTSAKVVMLPELHVCALPFLPPPSHRAASHRRHLFLSRRATAILKPRSPRSPFSSPARPLPILTLPSATAKGSFHAQSDIYIPGGNPRPRQVLRGCRSRGISWNRRLARSDASGIPASP
jgi:hypothetical protein